MAKNIIASLNIIVTFFLIFLCTFSSSTRTPFESSEINNVNVNVNDIDQTNQDSSFPMSVKNPLDQNSIFLPSENLPEPDSQRATLIQYEPDEETIDHESKINAPTKTTTTKSLEESKPLPLTVFRFGPIDRSRIPRRPLPLSHRRPFHHRCHHTHHNYKPWNNRHIPHRAKNVVITKINDDIEFDTLARGGARQIPVDWMRYDNNININDPIMFSRERSKAMEKSELLRRIYERYNQRRQEQVEAKNKENGSTFVKRIRKFLNGK